MAAYKGLWENKRRLDAQDRIRGYLFVSVKNGCFKYRERIKLQASRDQEIAYVQKFQQEDEAYQQKVSNIIKHMMPFFDSLPTLTRNVLLLHYIEGLDDQAIAKRLRTTINTVYTKKSQGKNMLRQWVKENNSRLDLYSLSILMLLFTEVFISDK
jgi:RNA polymerase sigma factor (sigma-70 family)